VTLPAPQPVRIRRKLFKHIWARLTQTRLGELIQIPR
jgi:hypothetical protein